MRPLRALFLVLFVAAIIGGAFFVASPLPAHAQGMAPEGGGSGGTPGSATTFTSGAASGANAFVTNGGKLCLDGASCNNNVRQESGVMKYGTFGTHDFNATIQVYGNLRSTNGGVQLQGIALPTCVAQVEWLIQADPLSGVATGSPSRLCMCSSSGASVYTWRNVITGTTGTATTCAN